MSNEVTSILQCLLGLFITVLLTVGLLYGLHPDLYREARLMCTAAAPAPVEKRRRTDRRIDEADDVVEYTPDNKRVRVLHPRTVQAQERIKREAAVDPDLITQITVTSSQQYRDVTPQQPLFINTYRISPVVR